MQHIPTLENKRAKLVPLTIQHVESLAAIALAQPGLFRFMSQQLATQGAVYGYVRKSLDESNDGVAIPFLVIDKATGNVAGTTRFANIFKEHKRLEIGWTWIGAEYHNSGLNKAMKFLMLQHAFEKMGYNRVEIKTSEQNHISRRAIESLGATFEGILRHHIINDDGSLRNTVYYSILKHEWPAIKERMVAAYGQSW